MEASARTAVRTYWNVSSSLPEWCFSCHGKVRTGCKILAGAGFVFIILNILQDEIPDMEVLFVYKPYIEERQKAPDMAGPFSAFLLFSN